MADDQQIEGLPPGAVVKPIKTASSDVEGLPPGAVVRPIGGEEKQEGNSRPDPTKETQFEKDNKSKFWSEAARTAVKIPLKTVGIDTNAGGREASGTSGIGAGIDWLKSNGKQILDTMNPARLGPPKFLKDAIAQMNDTSHEGKVIGETGRSVEPAAANETGAMQSRPGGPITKLGDELEHPSAAAITRTAASALPFLGPGAVRAGHTLARASSPQEVGEGVADAGGVVGQAATLANPEFTNKAIETIAKPVTKTAEIMHRGIVPDAAPSLVKALKPSVRIPNASKSFEMAGPDIAAELQKSGGRIEDFETLNQHVTAAKKTMWVGVKQKLGTGAEGKLNIDGNTIADAMEGVIDKRTALQNPAMASRIREMAATYRRQIPVEEAEEFLQSVNNELHSYYAKNKVGQEVAARDPSTGHVVAEGNALRKALGDKLDELGGTKYSDMKRRYGALRDVEQAAVHQQDIAARRAPVPLYEAMGRLSGMGDMVGAGKHALNFEFGDAALKAATGGAKVALGKRMAQMNSPEWLLENAFHGPNAFKPRTTPFEPEGNFNQRALEAATTGR